MPSGEIKEKLIGGLWGLGLVGMECSKDVAFCQLKGDY
jgi:hypothetical protein